MLMIFSSIFLYNFLRVKNESKNIKKHFTEPRNETHIDKYKNAAT